MKTCPSCHILHAPSACPLAPAVAPILAQVTAAPDHEVKQRVSKAIAREAAKKEVLDEAFSLASEFLPAARKLKRIPTGMPSFDRVLGGGLMPGSVTLLVGDAGIGKSTLLLQALGSMQLAQQMRMQSQTANFGLLKTMYASTEEDVAQIAKRLVPLGADKFRNRLMIGREVYLSKIFTWVNAIKPRVLVVDAVHAIVCTNGSGDELEPGSVVAVKCVLRELKEYALRNGIAVVVVGHITKDSAISGPRALENYVDVLLYLKKHESGHMLRCDSKNRFGKTPAEALFKLTEKGFVSSVPEPEQPEMETVDEALARAREAGMIPLPRISTGLPFFDRVLGGGLVPGSVTLLTGAPGVGKTTLLQQVLGNAPARKLAGLVDCKCLYVSGEESPADLEERAERLGLDEKSCLFARQTDLDLIFNEIEDKLIEPNGNENLIVAIDSLQTIVCCDEHGNELEPGSHASLWRAFYILKGYAIKTRIAFVVIAHSNDGSVSGQSESESDLEHMPDTVLELVHCARHENGVKRDDISHKLICGYKNRFGATPTSAVLEITEKGFISTDEVIAEEEQLRRVEKEMVEEYASEFKLKFERAVQLEVSKRAPRRKIVLIESVEDLNKTVQFLDDGVIVAISAGLARELAKKVGG